MECAERIAANLIQILLCCRITASEHAARTSMRAARRWQAPPRRRWHAGNQSDNCSVTWSAPCRGRYGLFFTLFLHRRQLFALSWPAACLLILIVNSMVVVVTVGAHATSEAAPPRGTPTRVRDFHVETINFKVNFKLKFNFSLVNDITHVSQHPFD